MFQSETEVWEISYYIEEIEYNIEMYFKKRNYIQSTVRCIECNTTDTIYQPHVGYADPSSFICSDCKKDSNNTIMYNRGSARLTNNR